MSSLLRGFRIKKKKKNHGTEKERYARTQGLSLDNKGENGLYEEKIASLGLNVSIVYMYMEKFER